MEKKTIFKMCRHVLGCDGHGRKWGSIQNEEMLKLYIVFLLSI